MRVIQLPKGWVCWVDDEDFERFGSMAWRVEVRHRRAYAATRPWVDGKQIYRFMHREIMDANPGEQVDHIRHREDKVIDNRRANLRVCQHAQNQQNMRKTTRPCYSCFKGVTWSRDGVRHWCARIQVKGKHTGKRFDFETDAALWYDRQALDHFGEFALTNFLGPNAAFASLPLSPSLDNSPEPW
jgi:hypothetical protein